MSTRTVIGVAVTCLASVAAFFAMGAALGGWAYDRLTTREKP